MKNNSGGGKTKWLILIGVILILIAGILLLCFLLKGEVTTSGNWPEPETTESLSCEIIGLDYPFFEFNNSTKETTEINAVFKDDELDTISLVQKLFYDNVDSITKSEAINHASMNLSFADSNLDADAFKANYAKLSDNLKMSLFAERKELNNLSAKYFLLDEAHGQYDRPVVETLYTTKGFSCTTEQQ